MFKYMLKYIIYVLFQYKVKISYFIAKSAGLFFDKSMFLNRFISKNKFQRLNAESLMWLVDFVEGDGYFEANKNGKYVKYCFSIKLQIADIHLLYNIKNLLGGYGSIIIRGKSRSAKFIISSKIDLKKVIIPIFDKFSMLISKHYDYLYFKECLNNHIFLLFVLSIYTRLNVTLFNDMEEVLSLPYFDNWLVSFI